MAQFHEVLFELIRAAFGAEADCNILSGFDGWEQLVKLSSRQGIPAVSLDGYQVMAQSGNCPERSLESPERKKTKLKWCKYALDVENRYQRQWKSAVKLSELFAQNGISTTVLKGFAVSDCYPVPSHRYGCDFDCYLSDYYKGHEIMQNSGTSVNEDYYKHSSFNYMGLHVENHQYLTAWRGSKKGVELEKTLQAVLRESDQTPIGDSCMLRPNPLFTALFLTKHSQTHFLEEEGISLKHLCDWGLFLRKYKASFDWMRFLTICREFGMDRFAESMTRLSEYVCFDKNTSLEDIDRRLLDNILSLGTSSKKAGYGERFARALMIFRSGWKFKAFSNESPTGYLIRKTTGLLLHSERNNKIANGPKN